MKRIWRGSAALLAVVALAVTMVGGAAADSHQTYQVTVMNSTSGQPFSPPIVVAHTNKASIFALDQKASVGVQAIAETGNTGPLASALSGAAGVIDVATFGGTIIPGTSATIEINAPAGSYVSVVGMLICTNDAFTGVADWMLPAMGMDSTQAMAARAPVETSPCMTASPLSVT